MAGEIQKAEDRLVLEWQKTRSDEVFERLYALVKPIQYSAASKFRGVIDDDEIDSTCGLAAFLAAEKWKPGRTHFTTFLWLITRRKLVTEIINKNLKRNQVNGETVKKLSLDSYTFTKHGNDGNEKTLGDCYADRTALLPDEIVDSRLTFDELRQNLSAKLSRTELETLNRFLACDTYREISKTTNQSERSVDNAIQRIRLKAGEVKEALLKEDPGLFRRSNEHRHHNIRKPCGRNGRNKRKSSR